MLGCGSSVSSPQAQIETPIVPANGQVLKDQSSNTIPANDDKASLDALWKHRMEEESSDNPARSFTLGAGDLLRISVPQIDQLRDRTVRVSEDNTIALPLVGTFSVAGMTEDELRQQLTYRVAKYMYHPQVEVFLQHTENRQVAIMGSVKRPGRYMLTSREDTLMTVISRSGGFADNAASRIILVPAPVSNNGGRLSRMNSPIPGTPISLPVLAEVDSAKKTTSDAPGPLRDEKDQSGTALPAYNDEQYLIDLSHPSNQRYLEMTAEQGDVIIVPAAGQVTVQGWVDKPGAFTITPGMTVLGSIAAAGGANFTTSATLLRTQETGGKLSIPFNLSKLKRGEQPDLAVQSGDVVIVNKSIIGAIPYTVYFFADKVGFGLPFY